MKMVLMRTAFTIAERGTCSRRQVGCVLADDRGTIVSWAYNGALTGFAHCEPHTDYQPCETSEHAERNAIYWCARNGIKTDRLNAYITDSPCHGCARALVQAGIKCVTYSRDYRMIQGLSLLGAAKIEIRQYPKGALDQDWALVEGGV
jgi:dCMP deaminase